MQISPSRFVEHRRACVDVHHRDHETAEWLAANYPNEKLESLDDHAESPDVLEARREIVDAPADFASETFDLAMGIDELESHYRETGDDATFALIDHRRRQIGDSDRKTHNRELTGKGERTNQRAAESGGALLANLAQTLTNAEVPQGPEALAFLDALPNDVQARIAALAQREADLRAIGKIIATNSRVKRLSEGTLVVLEKIGRNTSGARRRLVELPKGEQIEALADMVADWRKELKRTRAREWRRQRVFERALVIQKTDNAAQTLKLWRSLPDAMKETTVAAITRDFDNEVLQ